MVVNMYKITSFEFIDNQKKDTILFLHGWGCNYNYMVPLANKIKNANCLLIDLPGFKNNKPFESPKKFDDYINYLLMFLKDNNFKINYIVGHSFGGKLAIKLSNELKINHMFLFSPSTFNKKRYLNYYIKIFFYKIIKRISIFKKYLNKFGSVDYKSLSPIMKKTMSNVINYNIKFHLLKNKTPTSLFYGKNDKITPIYIGKKTKKLMDDCNLFIIEGDHFAYLSNVTYIVKIIEKVVKINV